MVDQQNVYIILEWQEQGTMDISGGRLLENGRKVFTPEDYPEKLPCHNPECKGGGFEIGSKISALLASGQNSEQNSLICTNAVPEGRTRRCLHTIFYSITCVLPYGREESSTAISDLNRG